MTDDAASIKTAFDADVALSELAILIRGAHDPALAAVGGMVFQVWSDGEVTLQKAGALLWQRALHVAHPPLAPYPLVSMPGVYGGWSYAYVPDEAIALRIRGLMARACLQ